MNDNNSCKYPKEKAEFATALTKFTLKLGDYILEDNEWTVRGFIDIFKNIHAISADTKIVSKILEIHLFPYFLIFAEENNYTLELATHQNWYPDLTFISHSNTDIKFAVDLKTTYKDESYEGFCNGFTLGSHGEYFVERNSKKNIQYAYNQYSGHFCLGIIYSRNKLQESEELKIYSIDQLNQIPAVIKNFIFFAQEKWKIASDKGGSGNTANIGSIQKIDDILAGNGVFAKAGEEAFDDYWANFGKIQILDKSKNRKPLTSFSDYLKYRGLPEDLNNPKASKRKEKLL